MSTTLMHTAGRGTLGLLAALTLTLAIPSAARADHRYDGPVYGFHTEEHLIDALIHIDEALVSDCRYDARDHVVAARNEVLRARREACLPAARNALAEAHHYLCLFLARGWRNDLDRAARAITCALDAERDAHVDLGPVSSGLAYDGPVYGFPGESALIESLLFCDRACGLGVCNDRVIAMRDARRCVLRAYREFCNRDARRELLRALAPLARYRAGGSEDYLHDAADHILLAMELERSVRVAIR